MAIYISDARLHAMVVALRDTVTREAADGADARVAATTGLEMLALVLEPDDDAEANGSEKAETDLGDALADERWSDADGESDHPGDAQHDDEHQAAAADAVPALAAEPRHGRWTEARDALLSDLWHRTEVSGTEILRRVNALPGPAVSGNSGALYARAKAIGLPAKRTRDDDAAPPPELADAAVHAVQDRARQMLRDGAVAADVVAATKLPLREALRLGMEVREERRAAAGA